MRLDPIQEWRLEIAHGRVDLHRWGLPSRASMDGKLFRKFVFQDLNTALSNDSATPVMTGEKTVLATRG